MALSDNLRKEDHVRKYTTHKQRLNNNNLDDAIEDWVK